MMNEIKELKRAIRNREDRKILLDTINLEIQALNCNTRLNCAWQALCSTAGPGAKVGLECWGVNPPTECKVSGLCSLAQGDTFDLWKLKQLILNSKPAFPVWKRHKRYRCR